MNKSINIMDNFITKRQLKEKLREKIKLNLIFKEVFNNISELCFYYNTDINKNGDNKLIENYYKDLLLNNSLDLTLNKTNLVILEFGVLFYKDAKTVSNINKFIYFLKTDERLKSTEIIPFEINEDSQIKDYKFKILAEGTVSGWDDEGDINIIKLVNNLVTVYNLSLDETFEFIFTLLKMGDEIYVLIAKNLTT
jgi:hypothetical protein